MDYKRLYLCVYIEKEVEKYDEYDDIEILAVQYSLISNTYVKLDKLYILVY